MRLSVRHLTFGSLVLGLAAASGCSSDESGERRDDPSRAGASAEQRPQAEPSGEHEDREGALPASAPRLELPRRWEEVDDRLEFLCPGPFFDLEEPSTVTVGAHTFERLGSTWKRTEPWSGPLVIGVLGAPKDASDATRANVRRAAAAFAKAGAHLVVVNGDLAEDEELKEVMLMLGEELALPVGVHAGNIEWAGAFTTAFASAERAHPNLINLNWVRDLDLGGIHLVSLPGYHDPRFTRSGACRYADDEVAALREHVRAIHARGEKVIVTAHGPPKSRDYDAIDFAHEAGNVGDPRLTELLVEEDVRLGIFGHILEAGGRATADLARGTPTELPVRSPVERLYVNAGSASSYPWTMHGGKTSEGIALILTIDPRGVTAEKLSLR